MPPLPSASSDCTMWKPVFCGSFHGSENARTRARLYGLASTVKAANGRHHCDREEMRDTRARAKNIANAVKMSRLAVPMSGSMRIMTAMMKTGTQSGKSPASDVIRSPRVASIAARYITSASFAISDG